MRVAVATVQVPFISGGAEIMTSGLRQALLAAGHEVEVVMQPFRFGPVEAVRHTMDAWASEDFDRFDAGPIDQVIALKFPAFYLQHHAKRVWLMHQHRSVYELFDTPFGDQTSHAGALQLREEILRRDTAALTQAHKVFTISVTVSERLAQFNGIASTPLHQPPADAELYFAAEALPYVYAPSRLEPLKRQELLVRAMAGVNEPVFALVAGEGSQRAHLERVVEELGLCHRVKFLGHVSEDDKRRHYAHALGVFFGPLLEDYGLVTLEAMLSARPVITCTDSGGPTHFVRNGETGFVTAPEPGAVAEAINGLWTDRERARELGHNGLALYRSLGIGWDRVVASLLAD